MNYRNIFTKKEDQDTIIEATRISTEILLSLKNEVKIGVSAIDIDTLALELCKKHNVIPAFKGVEGYYGKFPSNLCISVNDEILHAIPKKERIFKSGDIIKLDFGIIYKGFFTDHCITVGLGELSDREKDLIATARLCVENAVKQAIVGNTVGDISNALQVTSEKNGFKYIKTYCGHGIGRNLHERPEVLTYGEKGEGEELIEGMLLCIENQVVLGEPDLDLEDDGWTLKTKDGSKGAMFEHMVLVGKDKVEVLTSFD